ncbi:MULTISPECIES: class I SAM-dependent methyltransferase [Rhizobium/Agrobacterium group]|uniref:Class I SAM-dependent methyltransferase n=2 Tax=Rhizobium/Agrobacterium group TaxID=227290 RepID=B9JV66_ALLAM|nr:MULTISPECIES: class I SAM-dependent methyltransferase [Rhizobium/Agrobacterium group]ACM36146.1 conserved hypothetical protein [Allorhizobium ampelinum S4]MCF1449445.1 class I SAM-dependent methyltransferase [Allorhizobium ampelinum]MCF1472679.1 class I SAM-dependent methyltransferase [Allorhizobium ampelinum]MCF1481929.1 class I SAM-dependent methyltransferase [Allorhizobium ampelinum]MUO29786.1 class I SAM-dependent methyltransferase [Agrobacterium vitis]
MQQIEITLDGESLVTPETIATAVFSSKINDGRNSDLKTAEAELAIFLNIAQQKVQKKAPVEEVLALVISNLHKIRSKYTPEIWRSLIPLAQNHPVSKFFHEDPFTHWSFVKPRGYSGDAHLLDFIYGHESVAEEVAGASELGRMLYSHTRESGAPVAVRERRDIVARHVDEIASSRGPDAEIMTVAAGHLREGARSVALKEGRIKRWVALDQDPLSIGSIRQDFEGTCVEAVDGSVRSLLTNSHQLGTFDFIYASGLYDYLNDKVAVKLTKKCLSMLKPNGVFMFANFSDDFDTDGYMETFMNWALLLRSEQDMWRVIHASTPEGDIDAQVRFGANRNIVYGFIRKIG